MQDKEQIIAAMQASIRDYYEVAAEASARQAVEAGLDLMETVEKGFAVPIRELGEAFDRMDIFLPELMLAADAMAKGMEVLDRAVLAAGGEVKNKGVVVLGTVAGDIHDIGKNIVVLLLQNHGFEVLDLGKNASGEQIVEAIKEFKPDMVGLSALMTTTMVKMPEIIRYVHETLVNEKISFMVGGAVVTPSFAESIGAVYAPDGVAAVETAKRILNNG